MGFDEFGVLDFDADRFAFLPVGDGEGVVIYSGVAGDVEVAGGDVFDVFEQELVRVGFDVVLDEMEGFWQLGGDDAIGEVSDFEFVDPALVELRADDGNATKDGVADGFAPGREGVPHHLSETLFAFVVANLGRGGLDKGTTEMLLKILEVFFEVVGFGFVLVDGVLEDFDGVGTEALGFVFDDAFDEAFFDEFGGVVVDGGAREAEAAGDFEDGLRVAGEEEKVDFDFGVVKAEGVEFFVD